MHEGNHAKNEKNGPAYGRLQSRETTNPMLGYSHRLVQQGLSSILCAALQEIVEVAHAERPGGAP